MKKILAIFMITALLALVGCQQTENTINVSGSSELTFEPDEAEVWAGISIVKLTAQEAQAEANEVINAIVDGLRYKGFSEDNIETERLSLYEERRYENGKSTVVGWRASQTLKVKTTDMSKVGTIVDVAVTKGANQIQNINFGLSEEKEQEFKKQALAAATTNAKEKAETIADSLEVKLGKVKSVSEPSWGYYPRMYGMAEVALDKAVAEAQEAVVIPGDVTVSAQVNIVYTVK